ncbi:MAG: ester cyclase [Chlorobia bacterium]|nr:ester cyclase [Fimbriimonadaceae bacterium]
MIREDIVAHVHRWFEEVWNQQNESVIDEMMAEDLNVDGFDPSGASLHGRETFKEMRRQYLEMFPDLHVTVDRVAVDGDDSIAWLTCRGTAQPAAFGMVGEPKPVEFSTVAWATVRDGKYIGGKNLIDFAAVMRQLEA